MSSGGRISSSPPLILKRTGVENVVENSGKVGVEIFFQCDCDWRRVKTGAQVNFQ